MKEKILEGLLKLQRDDLSLVVKCSTEDMSVCDKAKEIEKQVRDMPEDSDFRPILEECLKQFGIR